MERTTLFNPFQSRPTGHEDRLTWAFVVMLKYDPQLQRFFRDLVVRHVKDRVWRPENPWSAAVVRTQARSIGETTSFLVSVLIADHRLTEPIRVKWSKRTAVYDGLLEFEDGLTLIVENKPHAGHVWSEQLSPARNSVTGEAGDIRLHPRAISLEWAEVAEGVLRYADSPMADFGAREMARDFLALLEEIYPELSPYRTFKLSAGRPEAIDRRLVSLYEALSEETGWEVRLRPGWGPYLLRPRTIAQEVHLAVQGEGSNLSLRLSMWPGDTVSQARRFYGVVDTDAFMGLREQGWHLHPKFHFSFMSSQLVHARTTMDAGAYFDRFAGHPDAYGQRPADRVTLERLIAEWQAAKLIGREDAADIERHFIDTRRDHINVIPGFWIHRDWPMDEIMALEEDGILEAQLLDALRVPLATWGESVPEPPVPPQDGS